MCLYTHICIHTYDSSTEKCIIRKGHAVANLGAPRQCPETPPNLSGAFGFWTLGSTARLVMQSCAVVRNSAVAQ